LTHSASLRVILNNVEGLIFDFIIMYYLKYRPHTIAEIDNTKARQSIQKILSSSELPHAFLFVGQKGTGKTSTARIFAKAVNCLSNRYGGNKSDSIEPCNRCFNCKNIDAGSSADVIELDAASNRGIEEVKNLIKDAAFVPMQGRYRVFIIDEAHMITHDGFNALLKTLEEPPPSVIFILATTNLEKVPKTIASRCMAVVFEKARAAEVATMLKRIISGEKLGIKSEIFDLIYQHSDRSFRDAAKLLQELVIQNKLEILQAEQYLGIHSQDHLLQILQNQPLSVALNWIKEFSAAGGTTKNMIEELLAKLHEYLLIKNGIVGDKVEKINFTNQQILILMKLLNEAYVLLKITPSEIIPLEIAIVEYYNKNKI